jgi:hypothetical protein
MGIALLLLVGIVSGFAVTSQPVSAAPSSPGIRVTHVSWNGTGWNVQVSGGLYTPGGRVRIGAAVLDGGSWNYRWGTVATALQMGGHRAAVEAGH